MTILIDDRSGSRDLARCPALRQPLRPDDPLSPPVSELCRLSAGSEPSADACFTGNGPDGPRLVGLEVKTVEDLVSSRSSGRLQGTQVPHMLETYDERWILTYGPYRCSETGDLELWRSVRGQYGWYPHQMGDRTRKPVRHAYVESLRISLTDVGFRCHHIQSLDLDEVARWIYGLWSKRQEPWPAQHRNLLEFDAAGCARRGRKALAEESASLSSVALLPGTLDEKTEVRAAMLRQLPGVGYETAVAIARSFETTREAFTAGPEAWAEVVCGRNGVGVGGEAEAKGRRFGKSRAREIEKLLT